LTDFSKMVNLARKRERPVEVEETYPVTDPWMIGYKNGINVIYSPYVPPKIDRLPSLWFEDIDKPFWDLEGLDWRKFKKRCVAFSDSVQGLTKIKEPDIEKVKIELAGEITYDGNWCSLPCIKKLERIGKGEKWIDEAEIRDVDVKKLTWNCAEIRKIISEVSSVPCGRCPID